MCSNLPICDISICGCFPTFQPFDRRELVFCTLFSQIFLDDFFFAHHPFFLLKPKKNLPPPYPLPVCFLCIFPGPNFKCQPNFAARGGPPLLLRHWYLYITLCDNMNITANASTTANRLWRYRYLILYTILYSIYNIPFTITTTQRNENYQEQYKYTQTNIGLTINRN